MALGLLVLAAYFPALEAGFVWDDEIFVEDPVMREASGLWKLWFTPTQLEGELHYWPVVYSSFWLEHKLWGFEPLGYHLVNLGLHFVNTALLWLLLARLAVPGAWAVAAVFAVHPVHVESVAWVIERKDLLSGLFYLSALWLWLRFEEEPRRGLYLGALGLFAAALLSKSVAVTLPATLLILVWWKRGRVVWRDLRRVLPFFGVALVITAGDLTYYAGQRVALDLDISLIERPLIAARALWFYLGKLLWPTGLAVIYPRWDVNAGDLWALGCLAGATGLASALWLARRRTGRGPLAGALIFAVTLSPTLGFVDYGFMEFSFVADRFQYLASAAALAVLIGGAARGAGAWRAGVRAGAGGALAIVLVLLAALSWRQSGIYRDDVALFSHVVSLNPRARSAHSNLSSGLLEAGRTQEALDAGRVALRNRPDHHSAHANVGLALLRLGRLEEAEEHLRRAIELAPRLKQALQNLGEVLRLQQRYPEALEKYRSVVALDPEFAPAQAGMGDALFHLGSYPEALEPLRRSLSLDRDSEMAGSVQRVLGMALQELGRHGEAESHLQRAVEIDPNDQVAIDRLATWHFAEKRYAQMLELYQKLIDTGRADARIHTNVGTALYFLGRPEESLRSFEKALVLAPNFEMAHTGLQQARLALEQTEAQ